MTVEKAVEHASKMTYRDAVYNLLRARFIPYRKATFIKVHELLNEIEKDPNIRIKQLIDDILTELDVEASKIDLLDDYCIGEQDGFVGASKIVMNIGSKYLKEEEEE